MAKSQSAVSLDPELIEVGLYEIALIDGQLTALAGTQAERLAKAKAAVLPDLNTDLEVLITPGTSVSAAMAHLQASMDDLNQMVEEAVNGWMTSNKDASAESRDALVAKREDLVGKVTAFGKVMVDLGLIEEAPDVPKRPGARGPSTTPMAANASFQVYSVIDGKHRAQSASQNSVSSLAFYHGAKLLKSADKVSTAQLKAAIRAEGQDPEVKGSDWEVTLPGGVVGNKVLNKGDELPAPTRPVQRTATLEETADFLDDMGIKPSDIR